MGEAHTISDDDQANRDASVGPSIPESESTTTGILDGDLHNESDKEDEDVEHRKELINMRKWRPGKKK